MNKPPMQIHMAHMHARACKNHLPRFVSQIMIDRSNDTDTPVLVPHLILMAYIFMAYMVMAYIVMDRSNDTNTPLLAPHLVCGHAGVCTRVCMRVCACVGVSVFPPCFARKDCCAHHGLGPRMSLGHDHIGHNYIGHNYKGHNYITTHLGSQEKIVVRITDSVPECLCLQGIRDGRRSVRVVFHLKLLH